MAGKRRRTNAQMDDLRQGILHIVDSEEVMTLRHLFYRMVAAGLTGKSDPGYRVTGRLLLEMRRDGLVPAGKIVDGSRTYQGPRMHENAEDALYDLARDFRLDYWQTADSVVECWCEKDAIRGIILPVTWEFGIKLMGTRGFASETVVQDMAEEVNEDDRPRIILALNDFDPSGSIMADNIIKRAQHYAPDAEFILTKVAINEGHIAEYNLPTRPSKAEGNPHGRDFKGDRAVELDAMNAADLQQILRNAILEHVDMDDWARHLATETRYRSVLRMAADEMEDVE